MENDLLQVTDLKRVLPGMIWNVTGILSFSHGGWELVPRTELDFEGAVDLVDALSSEIVQVCFPKPLPCFCTLSPSPMGRRPRPLAPRPLPSPLPSR